jgi:hypothetical protein
MEAYLVLLIFLIDRLAPVLWAWSSFRGYRDRG